MIDGPLFKCLVNGELRDGPRTISINPATEQAIGGFVTADRAMLEEAVASARRAFASWRKTSLAHRRQLLDRFADILRDFAQDYARLITLEQGKPLKEANQEVAACETIFRLHAALQRDRGETLFDIEDPQYFRTYTPLGVVAGIVPWNFPLLIAAMKIAPALLAGNAIIIKPAPTTPLATLKFGGHIIRETPPGLVQVLGDDGSLGPLMTAHPGIDKIAFTGSTTTGRSVMASAATTLKRQTLELGGNDPAIVLNDAELDSTAERVFAAAFTNAGQVCGAIKRVYAQERIFDALCRRLAKLVESSIVGDGLDPKTTIGPVQNRNQFERASRLLESAAREGRVLAQSPVMQGQGRRGYFIPPTLVADLPESHPLVEDEQFAPLLPIQRFATCDEAIRYANSSSFGLTASVWSSDVAQAEALALEIDAALVCVNRHNENPVGLGLSMAKQSGIGWLLGEEGVKEYLQAHLVIR